MSILKKTDKKPKTLTKLTKSMSILPRQYPKKMSNPKKMMAYA